MPLTGIVDSKYKMQRTRKCFSRKQQTGRRQRDRNKQIARVKEMLSVLEMRAPGRKQSELGKCKERLKVFTLSEERQRQHRYLRLSTESQEKYNNQRKKHQGQNEGP